MAAGYGTTFELRGVSFTARGGDVVGLIGANGSGKSTLLKAIAGVLPTRSGTVTLDGANVREHAARVAFVPQREDVNWDFPVTARDVVRAVTSFMQGCAGGPAIVAGRVSDVPALNFVI